MAVQENAKMQTVSLSEPIFFFQNDGKDQAITIV